MTVLNVELQSNLVDEKDWLEKLKDFCQAQGWTIDAYEQDKNWQSGTGFVNGNGSGDDYLFVSSNGFGNQNLVYRMKTDRSNTANSNFIEIGAFTTTVFSTTTNTNPVLQNDKFNLRTLAIGLPSSTILRAWFCGNDKFIYVPTQIESDYVEHFSFGSVELFDPSETEGNFVGHTRTSSLQHWFLKNSAFPPFDSIDRSILYNGVGETDAGTNYRLTANNTTNSGRFFGYGHLIVQNAFSQIRPLQKQLYYVQDDSDGLWFPLGQTWIYRINTTDLNIGEKLFYGSEEYIVFPFRTPLQVMGVAVRVA
jgi:hypothetical protein